MKTTRSILLMSVLGLVLQGCAAKGQVETTGAMTQAVQVGLSPDLQSEITTLFNDTLGRAPTAAELQQYVGMLENGTTLTQLRQLLASSQEAVQTVTQMVTQALGTANTTIINYLLSELGSNTSLSQLMALI